MISPFCNACEALTHLKPDELAHDNADRGFVVVHVVSEIDRTLIRTNQWFHACRLKLQNARFHDVNTMSKRSLVKESDHLHGCRISGDGPLRGVMSLNIASNVSFTEI